MTDDEVEAEWAALVVRYVFTNAYGKHRKSAEWMDPRKWPTSRKRACLLGVRAIVGAEERRLK